MSRNRRRNRPQGPQTMLEPTGTAVADDDSDDLDAMPDQSNEAPAVPECDGPAGRLALAEAELVLLRAELAALKVSVPPWTSIIHPILPSFAFPAEVSVLDVLQTRTPGKFERAVMDAYTTGKPTVVYDNRGPSIERPDPKLRVVVAVVVPATDYGREIG